MRYVAVVIPFLILAACERGAPEPPKPGHSTVVIDGNTITYPDGHGVKYRSESDAGSAISKREGEASGKGAGIDTTSDDVASKFNATAPGAWLPGIGASGGSTEFDVVLSGRSQTAPLMWAGIVAAIAGAVAFYFGLRRAAFICWGMAGALVAASMIPQWAWVIGGLAAVGGVAVYVYAERQAKRKDEAVRAAAAAFDELPPDASATLAKHADKSDRDVFRAVQKRDELGPFNPAKQPI